MLILWICIGLNIYIYVSEAQLLTLCLCVSLAGRCDHCCGSLHHSEGLQQTSGKKTQMCLKKYRKNK